ncbi:large-conductance mechanosensitive channel protein MscL [Sebaldella sp. S0638]|uniref:large-conductance mechanosensitive channel protein MscL n=1 Tax=Sebaldella sp. S0638 TaxID=2957809 RepID=UPI00209FC16E|nr:large-conductance mechanosensitive channel protein MscL [Sebaldella sp. S0638]MCP1225585.1 large-conductance mechanosensitive channel protein MscL [Sebaldella sp. S0638]
MFKEFKEFISKGNVIDLAVGVIIGGAFGKIVNSFVDSIIMPVLGLIIGKINFQELRLVLKQADGVNPELAITYGLFIQNVINFLVIGFVLFLMVKTINKLRKKEEEAVEEKPTVDQELLKEIRDLLKK